MQSSRSSSGTDENQELDRNHEIVGQLSLLNWSVSAHSRSGNGNKEEERCLDLRACRAGLRASSFPSAIPKKAWSFFFFLLELFSTFFFFFPPRRCHVIRQMNSRATTPAGFLCKLCHLPNSTWGKRWRAGGVTEVGRRGCSYHTLLRGNSRGGDKNFPLPF